MIGLYKEDGTRLAITYNSAITLNNPADGPTSTYEVNSVRSLAQVESIHEARPQGDGSVASTPRKPQRVIRLTGMIRSTTYAGLFDKAEALATATDPGKIGKMQRSAVFYALDFSVPTADTTNWATGLIPCRYYALASASIDLPTNFGVKVAPFTLDLYLKDPRRYSQTTTSQVGTGTPTVLGDYPTPAYVSITASGAGSATYSVANNYLGYAVTLNLSGLVNNDIVFIDMDAQTVTKNGANAASLIVGTPSWFYIVPGVSNSIVVTNGTNMTTTTTFRNAWCD
jgi:hypothetical protein